MKSTLLASLILLSLSPATLASDDDKQYEPLEGKWNFVSVVVNGQEQPATQFEKSILIVKGKERVIQVGDEVKTRSKYTIDATKSPKTIDIEVTEGPDNMKGRKFQGIYEMKDDTMTVVFTLEGERPTDLTSKADSGRVLQKFKRIKDK